MTTRRTRVNGYLEIDGERYATETVEFEGELFTVRELSADEGDDIGEAATGPDGKFNARLNTRLLLSRSLVDPQKTVEQVGKFGGRKYLTILQAFNRMNNLAPKPADPTPPAGEAGPASPSGGTASPQT